MNGQYYNTGAKTEKIDFLNDQNGSSVSISPGMTGKDTWNKANISTDDVELLKNLKPEHEKSLDEIMESLGIDSNKTKKTKKSQKKK